MPGNVDISRTIQSDVFSFIIGGSNILFSPLLCSWRVVFNYDDIFTTRIPITVKISLGVACNIYITGRVR